MKKRLDAAMEWLAEEPNEKACTAAQIFNVQQSSIHMPQHRQHHQESNSWGTFNQHGGNNVNLPEA